MDFFTFFSLVIFVAGGVWGAFLWLATAPYDTGCQHKEGVLMHDENGKPHIYCTACGEDVL